MKHLNTHPNGTSPQSDSANEGIDVVYTWVDARDPSFRAAIRRYGAETPKAAELYHYRDNGELRFSIRSLFTYAPWVRRIHVLTNGQVPPWLNSAHPRVHLVNHGQVFPDPDVLPTFNSNAIEMCLHHIPNLARRFIYFNDDVFLGRRVLESDFFVFGGGQRLYMENTYLPRNGEHGSERDRACAYTQTILTRLWGPPLAPRLLPAHSPQAFDRDRLAFLETLLQSEFRRTAAHRFRASDDLVLSALYSYALQQASAESNRHQIEILPNGSSKYSFLMLENKPLWTIRAFATILIKRPKFFCINDDLGDVPSRHPLLLGLRAFLWLYFTKSAPLEQLNQPIRYRVRD